VAPVEGVRDAFERVGRVRDLDRLRDPAQALRRDEEEPVIRSDVQSLVLPAERDRLPLAPDPRVDDGDVHPGGHVGESVCEHESALKHMLRRDPVRDVDHLDIRRDALDHAATGSGEVVLQAEIGQEGDELACDAASLTAATRPSRSWLSASATTVRPRSRASIDVTGPMLTHGRSLRSAPSARAAEAEAITTRSASGNESGSSWTVR